MSHGLEQSVSKMREAGVSEPAIRSFSRLYERLLAHDDGIIHERDITPLVDVPHMHDLPGASTAQALGKTAFIRLNGGLGTSMGMDKAKSLLPVRDDLSFLDVIVNQVRKARAEHNISLPLVFMNSFRTEEDTLGALAPYSDLPIPGLPLSMLQNQEPKLQAKTLTPVTWPQDPTLEWCPPGHGDVYTVLYTSGVLDALADMGFEYLNIANADNLGAYPSPEIAQWFADSGAPFAAEVAERTPADRKGGHLVVRDGRIVLRETAQTAADDVEAAADISRHQYFNTNTLWMRVAALRELLAHHDGVMPLPLIKNEKTVDPTRPDSPAVIQIEVAMGAAIELFEGAQTLCVDRRRFLPVKTTNDLLLVRSDVYDLTEEYRLQATGQEPLITLDPGSYKLISDFENRFSRGIPSLKGASSFTVEGPYRFGVGQRVEGEAFLGPADNEIIIPDHAIINSDGYHTV